MAATGYSCLGDSVSRDDEEVALSVQEEFLPCVSAHCVASVGGDASCELSQNDLCNASWLMWSRKTILFTMRGY